MIQKDEIYDQFVIDGSACNDIVINGTKATLNGVPNYPILNADYKLKVCNYNDRGDNSTIGFLGPDVIGEDKRSYLRFWRTEPGMTRVPLIDTSGNSLDEFYAPEDPIVEEGICKKRFGSVSLDTTYSKYYMQAKIEGPLTVSGERKGYCYAYAFNPIHFTYDFGDGACQFSVSMSTNRTTSNG